MKGERGKQKKGEMHMKGIVIFLMICLFEFCTCNLVGTTLLSPDHSSSFSSISAICERSGNMKKQQQEDNDEWLIGREREKETRQKQARNQEGEGDGKKVKSRTSRNDSQEKSF